jgi:radical SAM protein with 4Fe4S-binding SPASM domain
VTENDYAQFYDYIYEQAVEQYPDIEISCGLSGYILDPKKLEGDQHWCPIGKNVVIDTRGDCYPCVLLMDSEYKLGNIREDTIDKIKENNIMHKLLHAKIKRKIKISKCASCMWKNFCQSGCMGLAYVQHGTIWDTDEYCEFRIKLYENNVIKLATAKSNNAHKKTNSNNNVECF